MGFRLPAQVAPTILRVGMLALLMQTIFAWATLLGVVDPGTNFDTLEPTVRNLTVVLATFCPVAAVGAWFLSDWGPVLWALVIVSLGIAANAAVGIGWVPWSFAAHGVLMTSWVAAVVLTERRSEP